MKGVCKVCGCTMHNPCFNHHHGFCWWANKEEDLCSHCASEAISQDPNTIHCVQGLEFPVLTVHQPYALLLVTGKKKIKYRSWKLPEEYVGKRIFIHAGKGDGLFNRHFADYTDFVTFGHIAYSRGLFGMIIGSVVFGESQGPYNGILYGSANKIYEWPVTDPIKLIDPLANINGRQRIWKIKF